MILSIFEICFCENMPIIDQSTFKNIVHLQSGDGAGHTLMSQSYLIYIHIELT
jgi:hypothetical protein